VVTLHANSYSGIIARWKSFHDARAALENATQEWDVSYAHICDFVKKAGKVSGYPSRSMQRVEDVQLAPDGDDFTVRVLTSTYCGEGNWLPDERKIVFPLRWTIPDYDWETELRAELARVAATKTLKQDREKAERNSAREAEERALLEQLKAKYEGGK
jgi:hypothetical protein